MIALLFVSMMTLAQANTQVAPGTHPYLACVKSCVARAEKPGYELNRCNAECGRLYLPTVKAVNKSFCETYEEPCDDDRREDNQP